MQPPSADDVDDIPEVLRSRIWARRLGKAPPIETADWDMTFELREGDPPVIRNEWSGFPVPWLPGRRQADDQKHSVGGLLCGCDDGLLRKDFGRHLSFNPIATDAEWLSLAIRTGAVDSTHEWFEAIGRRFPVCVLERVSSPMVVARLDRDRFNRKWADVIRCKPPKD